MGIPTRNATGTGTARVCGKYSASQTEKSTTPTSAVLTPKQSDNPLTWPGMALKGRIQT
jgi:hypothetical protein